VEIGSLVGPVAQSRKAIEVELSLERGVLGLIKVVVHDLINELLGLVNHEGSAVGLPGHNTMLAFLVPIIEHIMELPRKRCSHTSLGNGFIVVPVLVVALASGCSIIGDLGRGRSMGVFN
jgi:hypothetical protein